MTKANLYEFIETTTNVEAMNELNDNFDAINTLLPADADGAIVSVDGVQSLTNKNLTSGTNTFPTFNQNTTGSAATLTTPRTIGTATGDVTSAGSSFDGSANNTNSYTISNNAVTTAKIADANVTLAKMANLAQDQFIGRTTASTGVPETATITAAARTVLDDTTVSDMVNTLGGATSTGTGGLVRTGSPSLVTPSIAAITVSGGVLTLPTGATDTLVSKNSTDVLTNKTLTSPILTTPALGTPASGVMTNVTGTASGLTAGDSTKIGGITVTGTPAVGYVPTATSTSAATWQAPSGSFDSTYTFSSSFEASGRFVSASTNATSTFGNNAGLIISMNNSAAVQVSHQYYIGDNSFANNSNIFGGSPKFGWSFQPNILTNTCWYGVVGKVEQSGQGTNWNNTNSIGFKIVGGALTGFVANSGASAVSTATLTTVATGDILNVFFKVNGTSSVDFYYRKNGGSLSSATSITSGSITIPTGDGNEYIVFGANSQNAASANRVGIFSDFSYTR